MQDILIAKLFKNGNSQAVRLPKEFRFEGEEVMMYRDGDRIIMQAPTYDWEKFFFDAKRVTPDFMATREDLPPQDRRLF